MKGPTKEQTLAALARVSHSEAWDARPNTDTWQHIGPLVARQVASTAKAAE